MCQLQCHLCQPKDIEWHIVDGKHEVKEHPERPGSNTHGNILFLDEQSIWIPKQGLGPGQHGRGEFYICHISSYLGRGQIQRISKNRVKIERHF